MDYNWNWGVLLEEPYPQWLFSGFLSTCFIAICAWVIAFTLATLVAVARTSESRFWRGTGTVYVEVLRNIPILVQIFIWFYVVPELLPTAWGDWVKRGMPYPQMTTAILALGFYTGAKLAEHFRAGILAAGAGQRNAAKALGFNGFQIYRYILLPSAYRIVLPSMTSEFMGIFKNSALALTIGVVELTAQANQITEYTFQPLEAFTVATLLYVLITLVIVSLMTWVEKRTRVAGSVTRT